MVFDAVFHLTEEGWRKLSVRWALFFFAMALLNEIVWRNSSTDIWVNFKVFGAVPLTFHVRDGPVSAVAAICGAGRQRLNLAVLSATDLSVM